MKFKLCYYIDNNSDKSTKTTAEHATLKYHFMQNKTESCQLIGYNIHTYVIL